MVPVEGTIGGENKSWLKVGTNIDVFLDYFNEFKRSEESRLVLSGAPVLSIDDDIKPRKNSVKTSQPISKIVLAVPYKDRFNVGIAVFTPQRDRQGLEVAGGFGDKR